MDKILIIDDELNVRSSFKRLLASKGRIILESETARRGLEILKSDNVDLTILDLKLPDISGLEVLKRIRQIDPKAMVIVITAHGTTDTAIEAMRYGAYDYILKEFEPTEMENLVYDALQIRKMMYETVKIEGEEEDQLRGLQDRIVGRSKPMQEIYKLIGQTADRDVTLLLRGESGTGKELIARAIYHHSIRAGKPFFAINCAAIPENLLESELFGHEKGAFTGADRTRIGRFEQCNRGTLFLDEIGDMSMSTQAKILRALQNQEVQRLGGNESIKVDVRIIAATNIDLEKAVAERRFREDLYYRLNVVSIFVPPLRQRREDIQNLVQYFFNKYKSILNSNMTGIAQDTINKLMGYDWPGNVRELENVIKQSLVLGKGSILLPQHIAIPGKAPIRDHKSDLENKLKENVKEFIDQKLNLYQYPNARPSSLHSELIGLVERFLIEEILQRTGGHKARALELLGITLPTLRERLTRYHIADS